MEPVVISVFTSRELGFTGNPAAIFLCDKMLGTEDMQQKATVIGLPATTFVNIDEEGRCNVRWFAPDAEINLCGHGAAAAGIFLSDYLNKKDTVLYYNGGEIVVTVEEETFYMSLGAIPVIRELPRCPEPIREGLGIPVLGVFETANKHLILTDSATSVKHMNPDYARLRDSEIFGYAITAPGDKVDFVSRTLVPHVSQLEDYATGSSHAMLVPFWAERLKKNEMVADQLSDRGGRFYTKINGKEVTLSGQYERLS
ncbi:MAG: PhzF family phenazine biosynthesis protein [Cytophagales bacterium]|uniref:PhzF family phenazine biosynthesis protein n=1 Tax=Cyclobacterium marinum TaxID=104 RepID=UPI0011F09BBF|nr:PhzF family phenazine biosynthesis protein [Cyclobacterium marinum]MBI0397391.1 PhzF family phenazine biosynthesis protein [Cyclobacterium marinum]MBR9776457.1 PhzF family phenazine biosynthesis protein [Cytophagales bacterium]|tara:strand:- start:90561 stop:91328 length:768 start_codon:yes stop_codon:yes gene_type:complete